MGICALTAAEIERHMPGAVLTLGAQDRIETVNLKGGTVDAVDIKAHKGTERVADLNYPAELGAYDLVVDCGTIEHCSNIFQAVKNAAAAVKVGGRILHHSPVTMMNHGYYNLCPVFFRDFYETNGWEIERADLVHENNQVATEQGDIFGRFKPSDNMLFLCVARRKEESKTDLLPLQREYR